MFAFFSASLKGLPTIRAFSSQDRFHDDFLRHLSANGDWYFAFMATSRWVLGGALEGGVNPHQRRGNHPVILRQYMGNQHLCSQNVVLILPPQQPHPAGGWLFI